MPQDPAGAELAAQQRPSQSAEAQLEEAFLRGQAEVVEQQRRLAMHLGRMAGDPRREADGWQELEQLRQRRDAALHEWSRVLLSWTLLGGGVTLRAPSRGPRAPSPRSPVTVRPAEPPAAVGPPPDTADMQRLSEAGLHNAWTRLPAIRPREVPEGAALPESLRALLASLGELPSADRYDAEAEMACLTLFTENDAVDRWAELPRPTQRALVATVAARARLLQDHLNVDPVPDALDKVFSALTGFSKRAQPGFVFGLMRAHSPQHGETWRADAEHWARALHAGATEEAASNPERCLAELVELAAQPEPGEAFVEAVLAALNAGVEADDPRLVRAVLGHTEQLKRHARFKKLRRAAREAEDQDAASEAELSAPAAPVLPADWPFHSFVANKRAAIVGGDLREEARQRIQAAFGFASLDWVSTEHGRHIQALAAAVQGGTVDLVILLRRFIGHDVDRIVPPACRAAGVPWVSVERGYGVSQLRLGMERYLQPEEDAAPAAPPAED